MKPEDVAKKVRALAAEGGLAPEEERELLDVATRLRGMDSFDLRAARKQVLDAVHSGAASPFDLSRRVRGPALVLLEELQQGLVGATAPPDPEDASREPGPKELAAELAQQFNLPPAELALAAAEYATLPDEAAVSRAWAKIFPARGAKATPAAKAKLLLLGARRAELEQAVHDAKNEALAERLAVRASSADQSGSDDSADQGAEPDE